MKLEKLILKYLECHPGASSQKIATYCGNVWNLKSKSTIYTRLRKLKKERVVLNKTNSWYLIKKEKSS